MNVIVVMVCLLAVLACWLLMVRARTPIQREYQWRIVGLEAATKDVPPTMRAASHNGAPMLFMMGHGGWHPIGQWDGKLSVEFDPSAKW